ncbi:MAG: error-prone DNA polymerase [Verrucomicrobiales bacterium]|nr:error-prone DNA polymerase [Verrucomicrobiales bacterium]
MAFTELHARSAFSFLRGSSQPEDMVARAAQLKMHSIATLDRDGVFGSARVHHAGQELGVRGIVGAEVTMSDGSALPVLVKNRTGYQNLCQLITRMKLRAAKGEGSVDWREWEPFTEGLICLSGDEEGPVRRALERGDRDAAREQTQQLIHFFGKDNVCVEVHRHLVRGESWINRCLKDLAETEGLPVIASNGVCYAERHGRLLQDAFTCLRNYTHLDEAGKLLERNSERYLKSEKKMKELFADWPEAIDNTERISDRLDFTLTNLGYEFPKFPTEEGETMSDVIRRETYIGARKRYPKLTAKTKKQLEHELNIIRKLNFCGYFLIVKDIVDFARRDGILVQGRGSAANSAVCYCLGITAVDAIKQELLFERFLSEGRSSWPDVDLDLPSGDRRERVIQHVYQKYAPRGAAMTANVITYRGRSSMREMGKVLNLPEDVVGRFSDLYGHGDFPHTLELDEQIQKAGLSGEHPRLPALVCLLQSVYGLPRHLGQHSGGMIISDRPLDTVVPLENASMPGRVVVQWDKDDCEDLGIVKVDLLGLGMMAAIQDSVELCRLRGAGREFDLHNIPQDDPAVYEMAQKADTIGVFQIESRAQQSTLPRMKPECFYDLVVEVALIRPGPIVGNMVHPYLNRRRGKEPVDYIHPSFEPCLKRTLGVPIFQEQVLQMAMIIADFTGSEAEELRRAISFNRSDVRMKKVIKKLRAAMNAKGVAQSVQDRIEDSIKSFALYGFPESHAISFALLAYVSVWLKVHRPAEFYTALINNQPMGFYSVATLIKDADHHGIKVLPVCVAESDYETIVISDDEIRLGLRQVKGLDRIAGARIVMQRAIREWDSLEDFLQRTGIDKDQRRVLAKIGALDTLSAHRRDALWKVETWLDPDDLFSWSNRQETQRVCESSDSTGYSPAFNRVQSETVQGTVPDRTGYNRSTDAPASATTSETSPLAPMSAVEKLRADYEGLDLTTGKHPMAYIRDQLPTVWTAGALKLGKHGDRLIIAGLVICRQRPGTAKGNLFISLEDETGISNAFVPSSIYEKHRLTITQEPFLKIYGHLQKVEDVTSIFTEAVEALEFATVLQTQSHDFH